MAADATRERTETVTDGLMRLFISAHSSEVGALDVVCTAYVHAGLQSGDIFNSKPLRASIRSNKTPSRFVLLMLEGDNEPISPVYRDDVSVCWALLSLWINRFYCRITEKTNTGGVQRSDVEHLMKVSIFH